MVQQKFEELALVPLQLTLYKPGIKSMPQCTHQEPSKCGERHQTTHNMQTLSTLNSSTYQNPYGYFCIFNFVT